MKNVTMITDMYIVKNDRLPMIRDHVEAYDWCKQNMRGDWFTAGNLWYFELEQDSVLFALRWS